MIGILVFLLFIIAIFMFAASIFIDHDDDNIILHFVFTLVIIASSIGFGFVLSEINTKINSSKPIIEQPTKDTLNVK